MKWRSTFALAAIVSLLSAGGFWVGFWPYGLELGGIAGFAWLGAWYMRSDFYILFTVLLAICLDGLSGDIKFSHTTMAALVISVTLALRYQGFNLGKLQLALVLLLWFLVIAVWGYRSSGLSIRYLFVIFPNLILNILFWFGLIKLLPTPGEPKLFNYD